MKLRPNASILRATPTFVGVGTLVSGIGTVQPGIPAGVQDGDLMLCFMESEGADPAPSISGGSGTWNQINTVTDPTAPVTRLSVGRRIATSSSETAPTVSDTGDHQIARIIAFRFVDRNNPIHTSNFAGVDTSSTSVTIAGVTTTVQNRMIVVAATDDTDADSTDNSLFGGWTNANLTSITEAFASGQNPASGGGIGVAYGVMPTAGAVGNTTATCANATNRAQCCIAINGIGP